VKIAATITFSLTKNVLIRSVPQFHSKFLHHAVSSLAFLRIGSQNVSVPGERLWICQGI